MKVVALEEDLMVRRTVARALCFGLSFVLLSSVSNAGDNEEIQENRFLGDRFAIRLVGAIVDLDTEVAAGSGLGALIDLEDILGFDEQMSTFALDGFFRFSKNRKHAIRFRYGNFDRDAYAAVEGTVPILDVDFFGEVSSDFVNQVGVVDYQYSFINRAKTEAGITAGLAVYKYELALEGMVMIGDDPDRVEARRESVGVIAPVPAVGFFIHQALRKNLILELRTSFIDLEIGDHNGRIFNSYGNLTWYFTRHLGVGVGLSGTDLVYKKDSSGKKLRVDIRQSAVTANLTAVF